jgi:transcription initiation factor TFIIH subunit 4
MSSIFAFLESQDQSSLNELYGSRWCCVAILQSLSSVARQIVLRLAGIRVQVAESFIYSWFRPTHGRINERAVLAALSYLKRLSIIGSAPHEPGKPRPVLTLNGIETDTKEVAVGINIGFATSLQQAWASNEEVPWERESRALPQPKDAPSAQTIERYASISWNEILHFLVGTYNAPTPDRKVVELLVSTGLLGLGSGRDPLTGAPLEDELQNKTSTNASGGGRGASFSIEASIMRLQESSMSALAQESTADRGTEADGGPDEEEEDKEWVPKEERKSSKRKMMVDGNDKTRSKSSRLAFSTGAYNLEVHDVDGGSGEGVGEKGGRINVGSKRKNKRKDDNEDDDDDDDDEEGVSSNDDVNNEENRDRKKNVLETHVTRAGFEFLLKDTSVQMWTFLSDYLATAPVRKMSSADILAFLFELSFCRVGEGYAVSALTETQQRLLEDFQSFGMIYVTKASKKDDEHQSSGENGSNSSVAFFYPTALAVILTQPDSSQTVASASSDFKLQGLSRQYQPIGVDPQCQPHTDASMSSLNGGISGVRSSLASSLDISSSLQLVVEKNFKVYAYTSTDLHLALLALFCRVELRLPNFVVATLTRKSVLTALERGITARQIAHFLTQRVHPSMTARDLGVPENIIDQLVIWQEERHRCVFLPGVLVSGFETSAQFRDCVAFAKDELRTLEWADESLMSFIAAKDSAEAIKSYMRMKGLAKKARD